MLSVAVLWVCIAVFDGVTAWTVAAAMAIVTLLGASPVVFAVITRRRQENAENDDETVIDVGAGGSEGG